MVVVLYSFLNKIGSLAILAAILLASSLVSKLPATDPASEFPLSKEISILRYLYRADQRPVSRETLLQEVWGYNSGVTTHTLATHIYRLRQKMEKDAEVPTMLVTEAGGAQALRGGHINTGLGLIEEGVGALRIHFGPRPVP